MGILDPKPATRAELSSTYVGATVLKGAGIDPTGVVDSTAAIQAKINTVRDAVRTTQLATNNVVVIPGGRYKVSATIIQPPYVQIVTQGSVVIEWAGGNGTCWWITPLADDPSNLYSGLEKNQWNNTNLIDGNLILRSTATADGTSIGLEMGSRTDLGAGRLLKGYVVKGVSTQRFDTLLKMNTYNHYLGKFDNCLFEVAGGYNPTITGTCLQVGNTAVANVNSGENFEYSHCIFASASDAIRVDAPGWDFNFNNCSFDYLKTVARVARGYGRIAFQGGHIESINVAYAATDGILVSTVPDGAEHVTFENTTVLTHTRNQIRGANLVVSGTVFLRPAGDTNTAFPGSHLVKEDVLASTLKNLEVSNRRVVADTDNRLPDPYFDDETLGVVAAGASLVNWVIPDRSSSTVEVAAAAPGTGKSIKVTLPPNAYCVFTAKDAIPLRSGRERSGTICLNTGTVGVRASVAASYIKASGAAYPDEAAVSLIAENLPAGSWRIPDVMQQVAVTSNHADRAVSVKPTFTVSNPTAGTITVSIGYVYYGE